VPPVIACDATALSGGDGVTLNTVMLDISQKEVIIIIDFNAFGVPDKLEIIH
jgi:hypothetical protein